MKIQWFPGHMAKTRRLIEENLRLVDICVEIADARLVNSSRSPLLFDLINKKPRILIMNKADIADEKVNNEWKKYFESEGQAVIFADSKGGRLLKPLTAVIQETLKDELLRRRERGMEGKPVKVMVTGVPNVGKSTFINNISGRKSAKTGDRPGVTTGKQWIRAGNLELLDTPGILCPKIEDERMGEHLAFSGAIRDAVFDTAELSCILLEFLRDNYAAELCARYKLADINGLSGFELLCAVAKARGFVVRGGEADYERAAAVVLDEFRGAKIGRISLERP